jgi:hypothetical protein
MNEIAYYSITLKDGSELYWTKSFGLNVFVNYLENKELDETSDAFQLALDVEIFMTSGGDSFSFKYLDASIKKDIKDPVAVKLAILKFYPDAVFSSTAPNTDGFTKKSGNVVN